MGLKKEEIDRLFGDDKPKEFDEFRKTAFKTDPSMFYKRFLEIDEKMKSIFPDIDKMPAYTKYSDTVKQFFSNEGANNVMETKDASALNDLSVSGIFYALSLKKLDGGKAKLYEKAKKDFQALAEFFGTAAEVMTEDEPKSFNQYVEEERLKVAAGKEQVKAELEAEAKLPSDVYDPYKQAESGEVWQRYMDVFRELTSELKATDSILSRDSDQYKNMAKFMERKSAFFQTLEHPNEAEVRSVFSELSDLANKYLQHVPNDPSSRQMDRSDVCNAIKAVNKLLQNNVQDPRAGLEKQFMKTLVYNENPERFESRIEEALDRATDIYTNPQAKAEISKLSLSRLVSPTQKNLNTVIKTYDKIAKVEEKNI